jgi:hypothetical protein
LFRIDANRDGGQWQPYVGVKKEIPDYWLLLAEGHLMRGQFASMLRRIKLLPLPAR